MRRTEITKLLIPIKTDCVQVQMFTEDWADNTTVTGMSDLGLPDRNLQGKSEARELGWRLSCPWQG